MMGSGRGKLANHFLTATKIREQAAATGLHQMLRSSRSRMTATLKKHMIFIPSLCTSSMHAFFSHAIRHIDLEPSSLVEVNSQMIFS